MNDHQRAFALLDIFTVGSALLTILFARQSYDIVLDLESGTKGIREFNELFGLLFILVSQLGDHSNAHSWQTWGFIFNHVEVLGFSWGATFPVVPLDVPTLPDVQVLHFLTVDLVHGQLVLNANVLVDLGDWCCH